jgi:putative ABC transport system ATP-binding protein
MTTRPMPVKCAPVLVAEGLVRRYGERTVIDHVSLTVAPGESVSLMGRSGCGKTTLLHMLGTLDRPDEGRILIAGEDPTRMSDAGRSLLRREHVGMVFQQSNLLPGLTARENIALPRWRTTGDRREAFLRADELLARFGLTARRHARGAVLSLGEAQRVAVARALINRPALVLADEPTGSLDSESTVAVLDALGEVCTTGAALLMVTHDPAVAARCGRQLVLKDGRLQSDSGAANLDVAKAVGASA